MPALLLLQIVVSQWAVAASRTEQGTWLVLEINLLPVKIREEAVEQGQPTLKGAALPSGL